MSDTRLLSRKLVASGEGQDLEVGHDCTSSDRATQLDEPEEWRLSAACHQLAAQAVYDVGQQPE